MKVSPALVVLGVLTLKGGLAAAAESSAAAPAPPTLVRVLAQPSGFTTDGDRWVTAVEQSGGAFQSTGAGGAEWVAEARQPFGAGRISLAIDRTKVGDRLGMMLFTTGTADTDFTVQLFDDAGRAVAVDLFGNLATLAGGRQVRTVLVPLRDHPDATRVVIRRLQGDLRVTEAFVFPVTEAATFEATSLKDLANLLGDPLSPANPLVRAAGAAEGTGAGVAERLAAIPVSARGAPASTADARAVLDALNRVFANGLDFTGDDFVRMAGEGQTELVRLYLRAGMPIDAEDRLGFSALMKAAGNGRVATMGFLLQSGADLNSVASIERTPLHYATEQMQTEAVRLLLMKKADPNRPNDKGATPLAQIAFWTAPEATEIRAMLVKAGADVNARSRDGSTPLINAARSGHADALEFLLAHGADVNARDAQGRRAMDLAVIWGREHVGHILARAGGGEFRMPVDTPTARLLSGAKLGRVDWILQAVGEGADLRAVDTEVGRPVVVWAVTNHRSNATLTALFAAGADPNQPDREGLTALHHLAQWWGGGVNERIAFLVANGASLDARNARGATPLMLMAARTNRGLQDKWDFVFQFRPNPLLRDQAGRTAQDIARAGGNDLVAEMLADYEARFAAKAP